MAYEKVNFSRAALSAIPPASPGKRAYYKDGKEPGLVLCVTGTGTKSFQVYLKVAGRPQRVTLGRFSPSLPDSQELPRDCGHNEFLANTPELNVRMARSLAALVKIDLKSGVNQADIKRAKRAELTLGELFEEYTTRHLIARGKKGVDEARENFQRYLGTLPKEPRKKHGQARTKTKGSVNWQHRLISSITSTDIQSLIESLHAGSGIHAANRTLSMLKAMYNRAIFWKLFKLPNPAAGIPKFKTLSRERFLYTDEIPRFFESLAQEENIDIRDYILMSLLTGARKANVLAMRWADVNLDRASWSVRGEETKNGDQLVVPLTPEAVQVLRARKPAKAAVFVFPGPGRTGHMVSPTKGWQRVLDRDELNGLQKRIMESGHKFEWPIPRVKAKGEKTSNLESMPEALERARTMAAELEIDTSGLRMEDLRIHDMRRTLGSWQAATGANLAIIGKSLGHKDLASTVIYTRLHLDPVRDSMQTATNAIFAAGGMLPKAQVTPIEKAKKSRKKAA